MSLFGVILAMLGCDNKPTEPVWKESEEPATTDTQKQEPKGTGPAKASTSDLADAVPLPGEEVAVIDTKHGRIVLRFFEDIAPKHVANFKKLANASFYNGTTFHRVIPGFMIQGGDPNTKGNDVATYGQGGPGWTVNAEFSGLAHVRGTLSMARSSDPNSAGSQFFVCQDNSPSTSSLDGQYSVFGQVVKSGKEKAGEESEYLKTVDKIVKTPTVGENGQATERVDMKVKIAKWPLKD